MIEYKDGIFGLHGEGFSCLLPKGAFYVFPNITGFGMSSAETAEYILDKSHVVTSPGSAFGPDGEGYIRICYASKYEDIQEALKRMEPSTIWPVGPWISLITDILVTDLPQPDSPTTPSV